MKPMMTVLIVVLTIAGCGPKSQPPADGPKRDTSVEFRSTSLLLDGKEISFQYRVIDPEISLYAAAEQGDRDSAHGVWLLERHYEATGEYTRLIDLAIDTAQMKTMLAGFRTNL